jgi:hypothetical protein
MKFKWLPMIPMLFTMKNFTTYSIKKGSLNSRSLRRSVLRPNTIGVSFASNNKKSLSAKTTWIKYST